MNRPYALTGPHATRRESIANYYGNEFDRNVRRAVVHFRSKWYAFNRAEFEDDGAAAARLAQYLREVSQ